MRSSRAEHAPSPAGSNDAASEPAGARRGRFVGLIGVVLVALAGYAFTLDQRAHYGDDYALRAMVVKHGWLAGYRHYSEQWGAIRPLGVLDILAWHKWLWGWPAVQQTLMLAMHVLVCLLLYRFVKDLTGDLSVGVVAAAVFAAWHSYTAAVAWSSHGAEALPAALTLLASLLLYNRYLHRGTRSGGWACWALSVCCFAASVMFHDQHLGAAALFSALALVSTPRVCAQDLSPLRGSGSRFAGNPGLTPWASLFRRSAAVGARPQRSARLRNLLGTWPFWAASGVVGLLAMATSSDTSRPVEPSVANVLTGLPQVVGTFWRTTVWQTLGQWALGTGVAVTFRTFLEADPHRLAAAIVVLLAGCALIWQCLRRVPSERAPFSGTLGLIVTGLLMVLTTLALMALVDRPLLLPRHTLWPAMGVAMVLAGVFGTLRGRWTRGAGAVALVALLFGLTLSRLGHTYEWTIRAHVTQRVLEAIATLEPTPSSGQLFVIDGVREYGRGFTCAWGLTNAVGLDRGVPVHVTTLLRRENGRLVANAAGQIAWPVDPESTRFFLWDEKSEWLVASSLDEHIERHAELGGPANRVVMSEAPPSDRRQ